MGTIPGTKIKVRFLPRFFGFNRLPMPRKFLQQQKEGSKKHTLAEKMVVIVREFAGADHMVVEGPKLLHLAKIMKKS
jgi:hypothetical protein